MLLDSLTPPRRQRRSEQRDVEGPARTHQAQLRRRRFPPDDHANGELGRSSALPDPIPAPTRASTSNSAKNSWPTDSPPKPRPNSVTPLRSIPSSTAPLTALAEDYDARGDAREARAQAEAALRIRESAEAYLILARLDMRENRMEAAAQNINRALQLEPGNSAGQDLKRTLAAKLAEKAQPMHSHEISSQLSVLSSQRCSCGNGRPRPSRPSELGSCRGRSNSGFAALCSLLFLVYRHLLRRRLEDRQ